MRNNCYAKIVKWWANNATKFDCKWWNMYIVLENIATNCKTKTKIWLQHRKILQRIAKQKRKFGCSIGKYCNRGPLGEGCSRESRGIMHIGSLHNLLYKLIMLIFLCRDTLILHRRSSNLKNCKYTRCTVKLRPNFWKKAQLKCTSNEKRNLSEHDKKNWRNFL